MKVFKSVLLIVFVSLVLMPVTGFSGVAGDEVVCEVTNTDGGVLEPYSLGWCLYRGIDPNTGERIMPTPNVIDLTQIAGKTLFLTHQNIKLKSNQQLVNNKIEKVVIKFADNFDRLSDTLVKFFDSENLSGNSSMKNVMIENNKGGVGIKIQNHHVTLENVDVATLAGDGIVIERRDDQAYLDITDTMLDKVGIMSLEGRGIVIKTSKVTIKDSKILSMKQAGIVVEDTPALIDAHNSETMITNTQIMNGCAGCSSDGIILNTSGNIIEKSTIKVGDKAGIIVNPAWRTGNQVINSIAETTIETKQNGIVLETKADNTQIFKCTLSGNKAGSGVLINSSSNVVTSNTITNFTNGIMIQQGNNNDVSLNINYNNKSKPVFIKPSQNNNVRPIPVPIRIAFTTESAFYITGLVNMNARDIYFYISDKDTVGEYGGAMRFIKKTDPNLAEIKESPDWLNSFLLENNLRRFVVKIERNILPDTFDESQNGIVASYIDKEQNSSEFTKVFNANKHPELLQGDSRCANASWFFHTIDDLRYQISLEQIWAYDYDEDGLPNASEDLNKNCIFEGALGETDPGVPDAQNQDRDGDGIANHEDNCPGTANPGQEDGDDDSIGDVCDNCIDVANGEQEDSDGDLIGNDCDTCPADAMNDEDADDICGNIDNCDQVSNPGQEDGDADGKGDVCDPYPFDPENDIDNDDIGADEDNCPNIANRGQLDRDNDGLGDACDNCPESFNPDQADICGGSVCAGDRDCDGVMDGNDNCPNTPNPGQPQEDVCGINDCLDDADCDGVLDSEDNCPTTFNPDQENICGIIGDADGDGVTDDIDNCINDSNADQLDNDSDGIGNVCDPFPDPFIPTENDTDGDGILNEDDLCPDNPYASQLDRDGDGIGDDCDANPDESDALGGGGCSIGNGNMEQSASLGMIIFGLIISLCFVRRAWCVKK